VSLGNTHTTGSESSSASTDNEDMTQGFTAGGSLGSSLNLEKGSSSTAGKENSHTHSSDDSHTNGHSSTDTSGIDTQVGVSVKEGFDIGIASEEATVSASTTVSNSHSDEDSSSDTHTDQNSDTSSSSSSSTDSSSANFGTNSQRNWDASRGASVGHSIALTNGHSESDTTDSRTSDSISDALTNSRTDEASWSSSTADTIGNSQSRTFGSTNSYTTTHSYADEQSQAKGYVSSLDKSQQQGIDLTSTLTQTWTSRIDLHNCILPVLYYNTQSLTVPWACKSDDNTTEILSTEIATFNTASATMSMGDMDCNVQTVDFSLNNPNFQSAISVGPTPSALSSGQTLEVGKRLSAGTQLEYSFGMEYDGQLTFKHFNDLLWTSDTGYLTGFNPRARITDDGHFIIEAKNIFTKTNYRMGNYTTVWSTVPKHLGTFTVGYKGTGYELIVQSDTNAVKGNTQGKPDVVLYDSKGSPLWMAVSTKYRNHLGYKHPLNYLVPTDMVTNPNLPAQIDLHNSIDPSITFLNTNSIMSRDMGCGIQLTSGEGLQSPNGRFKLYLNGKGNLIHKDGPRTMWESYTSELWYAVAPFYLRVSAEGEAYVTDSKGHRMWQTANVLQNKEGPFKFQVTDDGRMGIVDNSNGVVYDNSPLQANQNLTMNALLLAPIFACDSICKDGCRSIAVQQMLSNSTFLSFPNRQLWDGEVLFSNNNQSSLTSVNGTLTLHSPAVGGSKVLFASSTPNAGSTLEIFGNGTLQYNGPNWEVLYTTAGLYPVGNNTYSVRITDAGFLTVAAGSQVVWQFPDVKPVTELVSGTTVDHISMGSPGMISADGATVMTLDGNGIHLNSTTMWTLFAGAQPAGSRLVLQTDGTLVTLSETGVNTGFIAGTPNAGVAPYRLDVYSTPKASLAIKDVNNVVTWQFPLAVSPLNSLVSMVNSVQLDNSTLANFTDRIFLGQSIASPSGQHSLSLTSGGLALDGTILFPGPVPVDSHLILEAGILHIIDPNGKQLSGTLFGGVGPFTLAVDNSGIVFITDTDGILQWQFPSTHLTTLRSDGAPLSNHVSLRHALWSPTDVYSVGMFSNGLFLMRQGGIVDVISDGAKDSSSQWEMQWDGNLCLNEGTIYNGWKSNTWNAGTAPYRVTVSDVGQVLLQDAKNAVLWYFPREPANLDWEPLTQLTMGRCTSVGTRDAVNAGDVATIQDCNGAVNQMFAYDTQRRYLRSKAQPRLCLGADALHMGAPLRMRECGHDDPNNQFTKASDGQFISEVNPAVGISVPNFVNWNNSPLLMDNVSPGNSYQRWLLGPYNMRPTSLDTDALDATANGIWAADGSVCWTIDNKGQLAVYTTMNTNVLHMPGSGRDGYTGNGRIVLAPEGSIVLYDGPLGYHNFGWQAGWTGPFHCRVDGITLRCFDGKGNQYQSFTPS
ncbi:hypothetical protein HKX48_007395, partial [Thoreauomyces humboldtii]